jgi:hypothetical protein
MGWKYGVLCTTHELQKASTISKVTMTRSSKVRSGTHITVNELIIVCVEIEEHEVHLHAMLVCLQHPKEDRKVVFVAVWVRGVWLGVAPCSI